MKRLKTLTLLTLSITIIAIGLNFFTEVEDQKWHGIEKEKDTYTHVNVPESIEKEVKKEDSHNHNHNHNHDHDHGPSRAPASIPPQEENIALMTDPPKWKKDLASNVLRFSNPKTKVFIKELSKIKEHKILNKKDLRHVIVKVQGEDGFVKSFEALVDSNATIIKTWARTQVDPLTTSRKKIQFTL